MNFKISSYLNLKINLKPLPQKRKKYFVFLSFLSIVVCLWFCPTATAREDNPSKAILEQELEKDKLMERSPKSVNWGTEIYLNGRKYPVAWSQWYEGKNLRTGTSDTGAMRFLGLELLNTNNPDLQPINWFSSAKKTVLETNFLENYRYLDITELADRFGWQIKTRGNTLIINSLPATIQDIRREKKSDSETITLFLDRPTFFQLYANNKEAIIKIDTKKVDLENKERFNIKTSENQTQLSLDLPNKKGVRVTSFSNPDRLVIELRSDAMIKRDIQWTRDLHWRADYISLNNSLFSQNKSANNSNKFPVVWLEIEPHSERLKLIPITSNDRSMTGTLPLVQTARKMRVSAAINGGYFNRNNQLPLGAIRRQGQWLSGPILNRGAIAWNDKGNIKIGRLRLQETIITEQNERLPILFLNSAYLQIGLSRYTKEWGESYSPLSNNETIIIVVGDRIIRRLPGGMANKNDFPIPNNGYLLTIRGEDPYVDRILKEGMKISLNSSTIPKEFSNYSEIVGAGPVLLQDGKITLNTGAEKFSKFFGKQAAIRSAIAVTKDGKIAIFAVGKPADRKGATLYELAQILQQLGAVDALNLDGGSSTSLYLGGQLINPSLVPVAKVHNSIGIFLKK